MPPSWEQLHWRTGGCKGAMPWASGPSLDISEGHLCSEELGPHLSFSCHLPMTQMASTAFPLWPLSYWRVTLYKPLDPRTTWHPAVVGSKGDYYLFIYFLRQGLFVYQAAFELKILLFQVPCADYTCWYHILLNDNFWWNKLDCLGLKKEAPRILLFLPWFDWLLFWDLKDIFWV